MYIERQKVVFDNNGKVNKEFGYHLLESRSYIFIRNQKIEEYRKQLKKTFMHIVAYCEYDEKKRNVYVVFKGKISRIIIDKILVYFFITFIDPTMGETLTKYIRRIAMLLNKDDDPETGNAINRCANHYRRYHLDHGKTEKIVMKIINE